MASNRPGFVDVAGMKGKKIGGVVGGKFPLGGGEEVVMRGRRKVIGELSWYTKKSEKAGGEEKAEEGVDSVGKKRSSIWF